MENIIRNLEEHLRSLNVERLYKDPGHKESKNWLAEVTTTLKASRRHFYKGFNDLSQHIYPSISIETRKHAAEQIDVFLRKIIAQCKAEVAAGPPQSSSDKGGNPQIPDTESYINKDILEGFQSKTGHFNYQKIIALIEELNFNYQNKKTYSSCFLLRAILDHVPPMLEKNNFKQVVNNYNWGAQKSSRLKGVKDLQKFRNTADFALHDQISNKKDVVNFSNLPDKLAVNILLQECLDSDAKPLSGNRLAKLTQKDKTSKNDLRISFDTKEVSWANYSVGRWLWSSFRVVLSINNFHNKSAEYLRAYLLANSSDGPWKARHFLFQNRENENKSSPNEEFRVEAGYKETVSLFVSEYEIEERGHMPMPDIDRDTLKLIIETESGKKISLPTKPGWIKKG